MISRNVFIAVLGVSALCTSANAAVVTLDFEGIGDQVSVGDYYNGGGGTDFGVSFSDNALALIDEDAGGNGNFGNEPTPDTVLFFLTGTAATLNYADGFDTGFSFFYSSTFFTGSVDVYSGLNATGDLLATLELPETADLPGDPNGQYNDWQPIGVSFDGVATSIDFGGTINQIGFDNITFGAVDPGDEGGVQPDVPDTPDMPEMQPIPLPASLPLLALGMGALAAAGRRRKS